VSPLRTLPGVLPLMAAAALSAPLAAETRDPESAARGALLYRIYCQNCHGVDARGDGETAKILTVRPADLTRLRANGEFPRERLREVIDGRTTTPGHGEPRREMPIWGLGFQELDRDGDQEAEVRAKIDSLLDFLETLQRPRPARRAPR